MHGTHGIFDHVLFAILVLAPLIEWRWTWPRFLARLASGAAGVRLRFYRGLIVEEWLAALCLLGFWAWAKRPWAGLLLGGSSPLRLGLGLAFAALLAGLQRWQQIEVLKRPEALEQVEKQLAPVEPLLPHTPREAMVFRMVSVTAGICEETLFRGFLIWYIAVWTGPVAAVVLSSLIFGMGHIYLGLSHVPKTAFVGLVFACMALASGSLWPVILLHAAMDWNSGELGFRILSGDRQLKG